MPAKPEKPCPLGFWAFAADCHSVFFSSILATWPPSGVCWPSTRCVMCVYLSQRYPDWLSGHPVYDPLIPASSLKFFGPGALRDSAAILRGPTPSQYLILGLPDLNSCISKMAEPV